jgi:FkbM family methyltransferase
VIRPFDLTIRDRKLSMLLDVEPGRYYSDCALGMYLDNKQAPEPELIHVLFRALKPGDLAVDAGACVGFFTIIMSKLVGPSGKVIAIEPDDRNLSVLRKNLDINDCSNVEIVDQPLSEQAFGRVPFYLNVENGQSSLHHDEMPKAFDPSWKMTTTLDAVLATQRYVLPTLLKMDIEGSETNALRGISPVNCDIPYIVSEVNPEALKRADSSAEELVEELRERGYASFQLHADGALPSRITATHKIKITRPNTNMLFARRPLSWLWPEVEL